MTTLLPAPPILSSFDPTLEAESGIDPLGLQRTYEHLAERVLPSITVRMARPRFLTAMSVGAVVCSSMQEELSADEITPPWLVFEWIALEGFVRRGARVWNEEPTGIPGIQKTREALSRNQRLSHATYLKTAKIFGFTGIYRRLAHGLEILTDDLQLDEGGWALLRTWEREQRLDGFVDRGTGQGGRLRTELERAVRLAMSKGHVERPPGWGFWEAFPLHLNPARAGRKEARMLLERLLAAELRRADADPEAASLRREFCEALIAHGVYVDRDAEGAFFRGLIPTSSPELSRRLQAIDAYEGLCRPLDDAFRLMLHLSTVRGPDSIEVDDYAGDAQAKRIATRIRPAVRRLAEHVQDGIGTQESRDLVDRFEPVRDAGELFELLIEHHETVQAAKPPEGKRPWVERLRGIVVRPQYLHPERPEGDDTYVHWYRTGTAGTFLQDLGKLPR